MLRVEISSTNEQISSKLRTVAGATGYGFIGDLNFYTQSPVNFLTRVANSLLLNYSLSATPGSDLTQFIRLFHYAQCLVSHQHQLLLVPHHTVPILPL